MRCIFAIILELNRVCAFAMYKKLEFILFKGYSADTFNLSLYFQFMVESIELKKKQLVQNYFTKVLVRFFMQRNGRTYILI